ncbi:MAG: glycosyl transferase family 2 [Bacteroidetes bacterium]|nr:glycosyl transferase family 2 [Bacteroidota bacterium]
MDGSDRREICFVYPEIISVVTTSKNPTVCAIVLNWNGYEDTCRCLESLKRATYPELHVVVVDNGSTDGSPEKLSEKFPEIPLLKLP